MSTQRGNVSKGAPAHQNKFAFRHNKNSRKSNDIMALPNEGLCPHCYDVIEWKKKYRKYKPLTVPGRCQSCDQKTVRRAYHVLCDECAVKEEICAKCCKSSVVKKPITTDEQKKEEQARLRVELANMTERARRTFYRKLERGDQDTPAAAGEGEDDEQDESGEKGDDKVRTKKTATPAPSSSSSSSVATPSSSTPSSSSSSSSTSTTTPSSSDSQASTHPQPELEDEGEDDEGDEDEDDYEGDDVDEDEEDIDEEAGDDNEGEDIQSITDGVSKIQR
eukprot:TRINITY_DN5979_c0_g2_i2.p1 TRINITY_DN5979_c0_g2~~TRINITY_DN5979_c0_g2_i2.p1  ORF type:complete len:277 (+),score=114.16 TRINITY_DN5979_c0_g2_i2:81-911(+)